MDGGWHDVGMLASRSLPEGYVLAGTIQLKGNPKLWRLLTLLSVPWTIISFGLMGMLSALVRPQGWVFDMRDLSVVPFIAIIVGGLVATLVLTIVIHEAVHGVVLWLITGARPVFGFKGLYAYTDAPGWYLGRWPMLAAIAAPLILLPVPGLALVAWASSGWSIFVMLGLTVNTVASIGDLYLMFKVLKVRGPVYFGDTPDADPGEAGSWYVPANP